MKLSKRSMLYNYMRPFDGQNDWTKTFTTEPKNKCGLALRIVGATLAYNTIAWTLALMLIISVTVLNGGEPSYSNVSSLSFYAYASLISGFMLAMLALCILWLASISVGLIAALVVVAGICYLVFTGTKWVGNKLDIKIPKIPKILEYPKSSFCKPIEIVD